MLSEALEVVQQQADALESENKRLKSLQAVTSPIAAGPPLPSQQSGAAPPAHYTQQQQHHHHLQQSQPQDMPLVAAAALTAMHRALRHAGREVGYWRAAATRQGLLHGLQPLAGPPSAKPQSASLPPPASAGRGAEVEEEARAKLRWTLHEVNCLAARVQGARCTPRVVRLRLAGRGEEGEKKKVPASASASASVARDACVRGQVEAAKLALDYRRLREGVEEVLGTYRAAAATAAGSTSYIRKAPVLDIGGSKSIPRLVGRVRVRSSSAPAVPAGEQQSSRLQCVPVRVGDRHLRVLAERFGVVA